MQTVTRRTRISSVLIAGLLALYGLFTDVRPALAQTQIPCPLPAGTTPPADPAVTAQQVQDGSASLKDFALAVRERSREYAQGATTNEEGVYIGCIIRQDDGIWRSGSTYIVSLTLDGRVYIHAKDMALSGRQLNPPDLWIDPLCPGRLPERSDQPGVSRSRYRRPGLRRPPGHVVAGTGRRIRCDHPDSGSVTRHTRRLRPYRRLFGSQPGISDCAAGRIRHR